MAIYLQMDGVDDTLTTPSITITEVVMDFSVTSKSDYAKYWAFPFSDEFFQWDGNQYEAWSAGVSAVYLNGVAQTNQTVFLNLNTRGTVRIVLSVAKTNTSFIFHNNVNGYMAGKLYDVKLYNGATLQAHYDMTLGNVTDQSGNGRNATLTGGTWVDDGAGTTLTGSAALQGAGTLTASGTSILSGVASLQGGGTLTATGSTQINGSATLQGAGTLTAEGSVSQSGQITGSANLQGTGVLTATGVQTQVGSVIFLGVGTLTAKGSKNGWNKVAASSTTWNEIPTPSTLWR